jgi:hypothetical protein
MKQFIFVVYCIENTTKCVAFSIVYVVENLVENQPLAPIDLRSLEF